MIYRPSDFSNFFTVPAPTATLFVGFRHLECTKVYLGGNSKIAVVKEPQYETIRGYKAFHSDWTCRAKLYRVGETFKEDVKIPIPCEIGMHFCLNAIDIFRYYDYDFSSTKIAEVEATGDVTTSDAVKFCTNELRILREVEPDMILDVVRNFIRWNLYDKLPTSVLTETLFKLEGADYRFLSEYWKQQEEARNV